jgi:hypothetical protein
VHYKDGTEAKIGDIVKGRGYNVQREIVGTVVGLTPGSASCNIQVAHVLTVAFEGAALIPNHRLYVRTGVIGCGANGGARGDAIGAYVDLEYGQCDAFEKVA